MTEPSVQRSASLRTLPLAGRRSSIVLLDDGRGTTVELLGYGATVRSICCPDRYGLVQNVVLGFEDPARYLGPHPYFGATIGRYANRIRNARYSIDGREVALEANENGHQLHGGPHGFSRQFFDAALLREDDGVGALFTRRSPDGEGGHPGSLEVRVEYRLLDGALRIDFLATTDAPTVVSMTHHGYFDLGGTRRGVREQVLQIAADRYVPLDDEGLPTGGTLPVDGTPFDFRRPRRIGESLDDPQLAPRRGYDHPFVVGGPFGEPVRVATLSDPGSGRCLEVLTTAPVLHLYTGQLLDPQETGCAPLSGLCLETGLAPDVPNHPELGSCVLEPGETYRHTVVYRFGID